MVAKSTPKPVPEYQSFKHWRDVNLETQWRWPNFTPEEIACRGTGKLIVIASVMDKLQHLRTLLGKPIILNSAYRSPEHNKTVGGEPNSYHMAQRKNAHGEMVMAFDCSMTNHEPNDFWAKAQKAGFRARGDYPRQGFMHIDNGPIRRWNGKGQSPFPPAAVTREQPTPRFDPEPEKLTVAKDLVKPETIGIVATGIGTSGLGAAFANNGPIAYAGAAVLVLGVIWFLFIRNRNKVAVTAPGTGD